MGARPRRPPHPAHARGRRAPRAPLDLVFFPRGPAGAHQLRNDGDGAVRVLLFSDVVVPTATAYPDSDKVGIFTGDPAEDLMTTRSTATDYFHGERGAAG